MSKQSVPFVNQNKIHITLRKPLKFRSLTVLIEYEIFLVRPKNNSYRHFVVLCIFLSSSWVLSLAPEPDPTVLVLSPDTRPPPMTSLLLSCSERLLHRPQPTPLFKPLTLKCLLRIQKPNLVTHLPPR